MFGSKNKNRYISILVFFLTILICTACGSNKEKIVGTWKYESSDSPFLMEFTADGKILNGQKWETYTCTENEITISGWKGTYSGTYDISGDTMVINVSGMSEAVLTRASYNESEENDSIYFNDESVYISRWLKNYWIVFAL